MDHQESLKTFREFQGFSWIMVKPKHQEVVSGNERSLLHSCAFFHTTEYAALPESALDLLSPLVKKIQNIWAHNLSKLRERLMTTVGES